MSSFRVSAIIFDFNGVLADDETAHVLCFRQALSEHGLTLNTEDYYGTYLGLDERTCTAALLVKRDGSCDAAFLTRIMQRKAELFRVHTAAHKPPLFPGVTEFVRQAKGRFRLAVASGGRREQIERVLSGTAIEHDFETIVSADDCAVGKPDPAIYCMTLDRLNADPRHLPVPAHECVVVEDSKAGIRAAHAAGMIVVGVATTYPSDELQDADLVIPHLQGTEPESICVNAARRSRLRR